MPRGKETPAPATRGAQRSARRRAERESANGNGKPATPPETDAATTDGGSPTVDLNETPLAAVIPTGQAEPHVHLNGIDAYAAPSLFRKAAVMVERQLGID